MIRTCILIGIIVALNSELKAQVLIKKLSDQNLCAIDAEFMKNGYALAFSNMSSEQYVFKGSEEAFKKCWTNLLYELNHYMQQKGIKVHANATCYNRIYFNSDGKIAAYLYALEGFEATQEKKFDDYLFEFLIAQQLKITSTQNYWQYGVLKFQ
jgi:hypothetical protein